MIQEIENTRQAVAIHPAVLTVTIVTNYPETIDLDQAVYKEESTKRVDHQAITAAEDITIGNH